MSDRGRTIETAPNPGPQETRAQAEPRVPGATAATGGGPQGAAQPDPALLGEFAAAPKISTAYRPPDRWEDEDYGRYGQLNGAKPVWDLDGKVFAGPPLIPEVIKPNGLKEQKQAEATLRQLWHWATLVATGANSTAHGHYFGADAKGRHRVA